MEQVGSELFRSDQSKPHHIDTAVKLSPVVNELIDVFESDKRKPKAGYKYAVSRTVSTLAVLYEKARNAVEFRAEHLVRRAAIERIIKRRILLNGSASDIAENLVLELLWAKYIDSSFIDDAKVTEIQGIIQRYVQLKHSLFSSSSKYQGITWDAIMGIASSEIDESIMSARKREALNNLFYQAIRSKISLPQREDKYVNMLTYISVERAFAQADDALINFHLVQLIYPEWFTLKQTPSIEQEETLIRSMVLILNGLRDPQGLKLSRYIRKHTPPFLLLRDFFFEYGDTARSIIENSTLFEQKLHEIAARRYEEIGSKVRRAVVRSIIYIFLTKMVFALALEAPVDIFITKHIEYIPLIINSVFPPILLFLVAGLFSVPGIDNTKLLIERIHRIIYHFDEAKIEGDKFTLKESARRPILSAVFSLFYLLAFLISFGIIGIILTQLKFNIASQIIFIFFVTLVSFFAYRIRQSAKEYEVVERQGMFEPAVDFFFLPILHAGYWLSGEIAKINIFIFLFDFILEAPLKVIFEVVEEWIRFVRMKKEEII